MKSPLFPLLFCLPLLSIQADDFPQPYNSEPDKNAQPPAAQEALQLYQLPEGFQATLFAAEPEVQNPIAMAWDHQGRMWVAENYTYAERATRFDLSLQDRVLIFQDTDGDGRADSRKGLAQDLQMLTSVEAGRGGVWVMCPPQLLFIPDQDADDVPDGPPVVKLDGFTVAQSNYHNFANGLRWGPDGWLYGRCGHSCPGKIGVPGTPEDERIPIEGGIWRFSPETGAVEVITHGTTNPWGHDWDQHGELFHINTVNGHLWHGIHGAHFTESFGADPNPYVYERIDTHADHYHYDRSGKWQDSRGGKAISYGGGHSHIGMMIYQAEQWPEYFRNKLFTLNQHGRRTNVERLERHGNGYIGRHEPDIFIMEDEWFRGIDIRQGPDGSAYVLDWSDTGECHEHTGVHRTSGRIYRISYGTPSKPDFSDLNLAMKGDIAAIERVVRHPNVWYQRRLAESFRTNQKMLLENSPPKKLPLGNGSPKPEAAPPEDAIESGATVSWVEPGIYVDLIGMLNAEPDPVIKLRLLWTTSALGMEVQSELAMLEHDSEHVRAGAIRSLTDHCRIDSILGPTVTVPDANLPDYAFERMLRLAHSDESGLVRLALASSLQRLREDRRIALGKALLSHPADAEDHNQPLMVWFGLSPLSATEPLALVELAEVSSWPKMVRWMTRSLASQIEDRPEPLNHLLSVAQKKHATFQTAVMQGMSDALQGQRKAPKPESWEALVAALPDRPTPTIETLARDLSALFGDGRALDSIRKVAFDKYADIAMRKAALQTLIEHRPPDLREICESLLNERLVNTVAVRGLALFDDPELGMSLAKNYRRFYPAERPSVIETLVSRPAWAHALLDQIEAGRIAKADLTAVQARQVRAFGDDELSQRLAKIWGEVRASSAAKRQLIAEWTSKLSPEALAEADLSQGRVHYQAVCGACHVMYGQGGNLGPDLTGSGRAHLDYLLENILDPSAVVSADYQMSILTMDDGRLLTGVVAAENEHTLTLRLATEEMTLSKSEIASRESSPVSMMPEGLLLALQPDQVRDLIAYLQYPRQVPLP